MKLWHLTTDLDEIVRSIHTTEAGVFADLLSNFGDGYEGDREDHDAILEFVLSQGVVVYIDEYPLTLVAVENSYADGFEQTTHFPIPTPRRGQLEQWWEDEVFPLTGVGRDGDATYSAIILASDRAGIVGETCTWG